MADDPRAEAFERLVHEWAGRVENLAFRMLGNRADADDATQEVFLRLWERVGSYDPARPFQPWIYQVATRVILNRIRGEGRRRRRLADASAPTPQEATEASVERREREALVHGALQRIEGEERALLAMHYYGGLTQEEISAILDVPRSTAQSRIAKALQSLRSALPGSGHLAIVSGLEEVMRGSPAIPLSDGLRSSLLTIPALHSAAIAVSAATWLIGGIVVTKKLLFGVALLLALGLGGGFLAGRVLGGGANAGGEAANASEVGRLEAENQRLKDELSRRGPDAPRLTGTAPRVTSIAAATEPVPSQPTSAPAPTPQPTTTAATLDWSHLAQLMAKNAAKIGALFQKDMNEDKLGPDDQAMLLSIFVEYMRVGAEARALSPHPFFDERVLPDLAVALLGDSVGLSQAQRDALSEATRGILRSGAPGIDFEHASPIEIYEARERGTDAVMEAAADGLTPEGKTRLEHLEPFARAMLLGGRREVRIGLDSGTAGSPLPALILDQWKKSYGLDDRQADAARPLAERYARDAGEALRRRGLDQAGGSAPSGEKQAAVNEMLRSEVAVEREVFGLLSDAQRAAARTGLVTVLRLQPGAEVSTSMINSGGM